MFQYYIETQSLAKTAKKFDRKMASIRWILTNPLYIGKLKWGQKEKDPITGKQITKDTFQIYDGEHEAIVKEDIFYKTQEIIEQRNRIRIAQAKSDALFVGNLYCSCGAKMYNLSMKNKRFNYYKCENKECGKMIRREKVESKVIDLIFLNQDLKKLDDVDETNIESYEIIDKLEEQLKDLENEKLNLTRGFIKKNIEESIFEQLKKEIISKEKIITEEIKREKEKIKKVESKTLDREYSKKLISILQNINFNNDEEIKEIKQILYLIIGEIRLKKSDELDFEIYFKL